MVGRRGWFGWNLFIEPAFPFNEGQITERVTYWPSAFVKRIA